MPNNANIGETDVINQEAEQSATYHFLAGEVALDRNAYQEALNQYLWLAKNMHDPVFAARATSIALELQNYKAAAETGKIWADKTPHDLQTQAIAASLMLKNGCIDCAKPYLSVLLVPSDMETMQHLTQVQSALDDTTSRQHLISALDQVGHEKKDARALFIEADLQYQLGENTNANKTIDTILAIKPDWIRAQTLRIQILYEGGQKKEAWAYLNSMLEKDPKNSGLKWLSAKMAIEMGDTNLGMSLLKSITNDPTYGNEALLELAKQSIEQNQLSLAQQYLTQYQAKKPDSDEGNFLMGFLQQEQGKLDAALQTYNRVKGGAYYLNAHIQMILIQTKQGNPTLALQGVDHLAEQFPEEIARIDLVRAQVLLDSKQYKEAYDTLSQIIKGSPNDNLELHYVRGLVAVELGNKKAAEDDFKFVVSKNPKHLQAINALSQTLIDEGALDEAQTYSEQALNMAPTNPDVLDNMGWLTLKRGDVDGAIPYLAKAFKTGHSPEYAAHLGEALWQRGDQTEAINIWNAGLQMDPNNPALVNAMKAHSVYPTAMDKH
ncbi:MAG: tetratricopeptide repeat protein [Gammaproteobacteria bacterium]